MAFEQFLLDRLLVRVGEKAQNLCMKRSGCQAMPWERVLRKILSMSVQKNVI